MNVMAAICNSFSGRRSFASLTRSPGLNERAPVEEASFLVSYLVPEISTFKELKHDTQNWLAASNNNNQNCDVIWFAC